VTTLTQPPDSHAAQPDPSPAADPDPGQTSSPVDPTARARLSKLRIPALVVAAIVLVALVTALIESRSHGGYLDPESAAPDGAMAIRVLLEQQGVQVTVARSTGTATTAAGGSTLVVASSNLLSAGQLAELSGTASSDLVLLDPSPDVLRQLAPELEPIGSVATATRAPVCALDAAQRAGPAVTGGSTFQSIAAGVGGVQLCYPDNGAATLARITGSDGRTVTVLGSGTTFTNALLGNEGNAALALNLLGQHQQLTWYVATPEVGSGGASASQLLPTWVLIALVQLALAVLALAFWRGRRLGPVVVEPLPVVVRAAEATEGRARLYRRSGARDLAALHLRAAAIARLTPLVGLDRGASPAEVCSAISAHSGWQPADVAALMYGSAPPDDQALVRLASGLDTLERTVSGT
jgi:Domain of unknown function (DUF4350)